MDGVLTPGSVSGILLLEKDTYLQVRQPDRDLSRAWDNRSLDGILTGDEDEERFVRR